MIISQGGGTGIHLKMNITKACGDQLSLERLSFGDCHFKPERALLIADDNNQKRAKTQFVMKF